MAAQTFQPKPSKLLQIHFCALGLQVRVHSLLYDEHVLLQHQSSFWYRLREWGILSTLK